MAEIYLPTLLFWENGNTWYGSCGNLRFYIKPVKHEEGENEGTVTLDAELWRGPLAKEFSEIFTTGSYPQSDEGLEQMKRWLAEEASKLRD